MATNNFRYTATKTLPQCNNERSQKWRKCVTPRQERSYSSATVSSMIPISRPDLMLKATTTRMMKRI